MKNLYNGVYAKLDILPYEEVILKNAKSYAQQVIDKNQISLRFYQLILILIQMVLFKAPYQTSPGTDGNGYIVITKDKIDRRYTIVGTQLLEAT